MSISNDRCDPTDRSHDPKPPMHHDAANHAVLMPDVTCPGCGCAGRIKQNSWGVSPPHGWWVENATGRMFCSSECIAHVRPR